MTTLQLGEPLDVSTFPRTLLYDGSEKSFFFEELNQTIQDIMYFLGVLGVVKRVDSFGFAVAVSDIAIDSSLEGSIEIDDPSTYVAFVGGWGPEQDRYIANAIRKMRASLDSDENDTIKITQDGVNEHYNTVESVDENGNFPWGNFAWGGSAYVAFGNYNHLVSVSALKQDEDDVASSIIGKLIGMKRHRANMPLES